MTLADLANLASVASFLVTVFGIWKLWPIFHEWKLRRDAWDLYVELRKEAGDDIYGIGWPFKPGTRRFELAEYLVDHGKLQRRANGRFGLWVSKLERDGCD